MPAATQRVAKPVEDAIQSAPSVSKQLLARQPLAAAQTSISAVWTDSAYVNESHEYGCVEGRQSHDCTHVLERKKKTRTTKKKKTRTTKKEKKKRKKNHINNNNHTYNKKKHQRARESRRRWRRRKKKTEQKQTQKKKTTSNCRESTQSNPGCPVMHVNISKTIHIIPRGSETLSASSDLLWAKFESFHSRSGPKKCVWQKGAPRNERRASPHDLCAR